MPITVHSPFSGKPVKVRDEDVGRAVRDEAGRVFYVVPRTDGAGHYGSPTRHGSADAEKRAIEIEQRVAAGATVDEDTLEVHDARGAGRPGERGRMVVLTIVGLAIVLILTWLFTVGPLGAWKWQKGPPANLIPMGGGGASTYPAERHMLQTVSGSAVGAVIDENHIAPVPTTLPAGTVTLPSGVKYFITKEGTGVQATKGDKVYMLYTGAFIDGTIFDASSRHPKDGPFPFTIGGGGVIEGWQVGVEGMREGEKRTLLIPPAMGYGPSGSPPDIPPNTPLRFDVELVRVERPEK